MLLVLDESAVDIEGEQFVAVEGKAWGRWRGHGDVGVRVVCHGVLGF